MAKVWQPDLYIVRLVSMEVKESYKEQKMIILNHTNPNALGSLLFISEVNLKISCPMHSDASSISDVGVLFPV